MSKSREKSLAAMYLIGVKAVIQSRQTLRNYLGQVWKPPSTSSYNSPDSQLFCLRAASPLSYPSLFIYLGSRCNQRKTTDFMSRGLFASLGPKDWVTTLVLEPQTQARTIWLCLICHPMVMKDDKYGSS